MNSCFQIKVTPPTRGVSKENHAVKRQRKNFKYPSIQKRVRKQSNPPQFECCYFEFDASSSSTTGPETTKNINAHVINTSNTPQRKSIDSIGFSNTIVDETNMKPNLERRKLVDNLIARINMSTVCSGSRSCLASSHANHSDIDLDELTRIVTLDFNMDKQNEMIFTNEECEGYVNSFFPKMNTNSSSNNTSSVITQPGLGKNIQFPVPMLNMNIDSVSHDLEKLEKEMLNSLYSMMSEITRP